MKGMLDTSLYSEISVLPNSLKKEVRDFVALLKKKAVVSKGLKERKPGIAKGFFKMADDFDEPLDDFKDYM